MIEIKNRFSGEVIFSHKTTSIKVAVEAAVNAGADLSGANLSRANLSGADLSGADLSEANLSRADLSRANLSGANLSEADLSEANLSRANLSRANLSWVNLSWANLSWVNLSWANLSRANLSGANLSGANIYVTSWNLGCGSLNVTVDSKIAIQFLYHFCRLKCDDKEVKAIQQQAAKLANKFHLIGQESCCTKLEE